MYCHSVRPSESWTFEWCDPNGFERILYKVQTSYVDVSAESDLDVDVRVDDDFHSTVHASSSLRV